MCITLLVSEKSKRGWITFFNLVKFVNPKVETGVMQLQVKDAKDCQLPRETKEGRKDTSSIFRWSMAMMTT